MTPDRWTPATPPPGAPRLWRSPDDRILAGVLGGIAERFALDPMLVRVVFGVALVFTGAFPLLVVYALLWWLVPVRGVES